MAADGQEAVDFLYRRGTYSEAERPDLILLDLNLPKKSGIEVLSEINQDADLSTIAVIVVTTSAVEADLEMCKDLGARLCITKPLDFEEYVTAIKGIQGIRPNSVSNG